jgi:RHS repeat-associated protein
MHQPILHPLPPLRVYSPFGTALAGRCWSAESGYRYGFNGKEKDDEGMGGGDQTYDYGFRIYNPGLAKFLSVDPLHKSFPWYTPYQFAGNKPIWAIDLDGLEEFKVTGNTITITMKYAAFQSRPQGGNVPKDFDIKAMSKQHWDTYNIENSNAVGLSISCDEQGNVQAVSIGETQYSVVFDVQVEVFADENSPEFQEYKKSETFTGVYLFGDTEFEGVKIEHAKLTTEGTEVVPAFTQSITGDFNNSYYCEEIVAFADMKYFTKNVEVHEDGHTIGLSHWGTETQFAKAYPRYRLQDSVQGQRECFENHQCYDSEGMMKFNGGDGSQAMKSTQVVNALNCLEGKK